MIEFRRVSKVYHTGTHALNDVSFKIMDGEFVFIIGRSGAGKSTLIKLLTCEEKPSEGSVLIDDFDISRIRRSLVPYLRRNIGMIFQDFRLIYTKTVYENVAFAMEIIGASRRSIQRRVPIVLSIVGLKDKANAKPGELSGGEQQRVAVARAMVNNPMLILADEPTGNLDPTNSESVMALLEEINRGGTTVIICTHDHELVDRMKKRVVEISDGLLIRDDCEGAYANCKIVAPEYIETAELENEFGQIDVPAVDAAYAANEEEHQAFVDEQDLSEFDQEQEYLESLPQAELELTAEDDVFDGDFLPGSGHSFALVDELKNSLQPEQSQEQEEVLQAEQQQDYEEVQETELTQELEELQADGDSVVTARRTSREERLARALRKYKEQGHDIFLPGSDDENSTEPIIPEKEDLEGLSTNTSGEAIS